MAGRIFILANMNLFIFEEINFMKTAINISLLFLLSIIFGSCQNQTAPKEEANQEESRIKIEMFTSQGRIIVELYNETPQHRDNFASLVREGAFDSLLFHRVIENFMIQGGDPDSKYAQAGDTLGNGDRDYRVDAEFRPELFHKKGALAGARDANPERGSSAMQFYIVQGKVFTDSTLDMAEIRINDYLASHYARSAEENKELSKALEESMDKGDWDLYKNLNDSLIAYGRTHELFEYYRIPENQRVVYKTIGGTPHLDQSYTVFGEVIEGLEIVDKIAALETGANDRPVEDVRIISVKVIE